MDKQTERGSTLVLVTWILLVIGIVAGFLIYRAQMEWAVYQNLEDSMALRERAETILQEYVTLFSGDESEQDGAGDAWYGGGRVEQEWNGFVVTLMIEDEGSKPNLNLINREGLQAALAENESPDPILDWRDSDDEIRENGAENTFYQALEKPYKARDGFFTTLSELKQLKNGMTFYDQLASELTVFGRYNPNTMTRDDFYTFLLSNGYEKAEAERIANSFEDKIIKPKKRLNSEEDFKEISVFRTQDRWKRLTKLMQYEGRTNPNLISDQGINILLHHLGYEQNVIDEFVQRRSERPFDSLGDVESLFKGKKPERAMREHFTLQTRVVRYRIWVSKGEQRLYLEAVYERVPGKTTGTWRVRPLYRHVAQNRDVPEPPSAPEPPAEESNGG